MIVEPLKVNTSTSANKGISILTPISSLYRALTKNMALISQV
jgi:hypothetical protein